MVTAYVGPKGREERKEGPMQKTEPEGTSPSLEVHSLVL